jgi:hypothetical protein
MIYYFYNKTDKTKEAIFQLTASDELTALNYFAKLKQLSEGDFLELYTIGIKNR